MKDFQTDHSHSYLESPPALGGMFREEESHPYGGNFPVAVFPKPIQNYILGLIAETGFHAEFIGAAILSIAASAMGKNIQLRLSSTMTVTPALYVAFVGRSGVGKTPPIKIVKTPLAQIDKLLYKEYQHALSEYKKSKDENGVPPSRKDFILNDATPESLKQRIAEVDTGVLLHYDELPGLINSSIRYGQSSLIQDLLSYFSVDPLKVNRIVGAESYMDEPCLNILGTIQTDLISLFLSGEVWKDGLTNRFIFVYPDNQLIPYLNLSGNAQGANPLLKEWSAIINKLFSEIYRAPQRKEIFLTPNAETRFMEWDKKIVDKTNDSDTDERIAVRAPKLKSILKETHCSSF